MPDLIQPRRDQPGVVKRVVLWVLTVLFLLLGVVGWLVPVVTGVPFYVLAAVTAGMASPRVARWINVRERRLPRRWRLLLRPKLRRAQKAAQQAAQKPAQKSAQPRDGHPPRG